MKISPRTVVLLSVVSSGVITGGAQGESWPLVGLTPSQAMDGKTIRMKTEAIQTLEPAYVENEREAIGLVERNGRRLHMTGTFTQDFRSEGSRFLIEQHSFVDGDSYDISAVSHDGKGMESFRGSPNTGTILTFRGPSADSNGLANPYGSFNFRNAIFEWARWNSGSPQGGYAAFPFSVEQLNKAPGVLDAAAKGKSQTVVRGGQSVSQVEMEANDPLLERRVRYKVFLSQPEGRCLGWTADSIMRDSRMEYEVQGWAETEAPDGQKVVYPEKATFRLLRAYHKSGEYVPSITWQLRVRDFEILDTPGAEKFQINRALAHTITDMATGKWVWANKR